MDYDIERLPLVQTFLRLYWQQTADLLYQSNVEEAARQFLKESSARESKAFLEQLLLLSADGAYMNNVPALLYSRSLAEKTGGRLLSLMTLLH